MTARPGIAPITRYQYERALARLDAALDGRPLDDAALADYLLGLFESGMPQGTVQQVVSAVRYRARLAGEDDPVGPDSAYVLAENRYGNLPPSAEARLVAGVRLRAKLLGDPDPAGSDSEIVREFKRRNGRIQKLKSGRGRMPEGRRFMGELYRRDLDYPKTLLKGADFRTCRACRKPDVRMSGIYWCFACAYMIGKARRQIRGTESLLTSIFGGRGYHQGDVEWKSLMTIVREIRAHGEVPRA